MRSGRGHWRHSEAREDPREWIVGRVHACFRERDSSPTPQGLLARQTHVNRARRRASETDWCCGRVWRRFPSVAVTTPPKTWIPFCREDLGGPGQRYVYIQSPAVEACSSAHDAKVTAGVARADSIEWKRAVAALKSSAVREELQGGRSGFSARTEAPTYLLYLTSLQTSPGAFPGLGCPVVTARVWFK